MGKRKWGIKRSSQHEFLVLGHFLAFSPIFIVDLLQFGFWSKVLYQMALLKLDKTRCYVSNISYIFLSLPFLFWLSISFISFSYPPFFTTKDYIYPGSYNYTLLKSNLDSSLEMNIIPEIYRHACISSSSQLTCLVCREITGKEFTYAVGINKNTPIILWSLTNL